MRVNTTGCCGMLELADISTEPTPKDILTYCMTGGLPVRGQRKRPFVIYSGVVERYQGDHASDRTDNYGQALTDFIKANNLGEVYEGIPTRRNFTHNMLKMWVWMPDYDALWNWWDTQKSVEVPKRHLFYDVDGIRLIGGM